VRTIAGLADCGKEGTVAANDELTIRFRVIAGEDILVISRDFSNRPEALTAIGDALNEQRSLILLEARYDREADVTGLVINLANVVTAQVSTKDNAATGQYL
jgi:hypothetical protein